MEHTKLPLENDFVANNHEKAPHEYVKASGEYEKAPAEHVIPPEFPEYVPTAKKKKKGINPMLMYVFSGFLVLYMAFGFLYPGNSTNNGGGYVPDDDSGNTPPSFPNSSQLPTVQDAEMFKNYEEALNNSVSLYVNDDYVGATVAIADALKEKYYDYNFGNLSGLVMSYENGALKELSTDGAPKDSGTYLWIEKKTIYIEDDKDGTLYPEENIIVSLVRASEKKAKNANVSILQMTFPVNNLEYGYMYFSASYLQATMNKYFIGEKAVLTVFSASQNDYGADEETVRGNYVIYGSMRVEGKLQDGAFYGETLLQNRGIKLSADKCSVVISEEYTDYGWIYALRTNGIFDPRADCYANLSDYEHGTDEFTKKWDKAMNDPNVYGIYYEQGGYYPQVYLKNLSDADDAWEGYVHDWNTPEFPLTEILAPWSVLQQHT